MPVPSLRITEEWIKREVTVLTLLVSDASNPITVGISKDITALQLYHERRPRQTSNCRTESTECHNTIRNRYGAVPQDNRTPAKSIRCIPVERRISDDYGRTSFKAHCRTKVV